MILPGRASLIIEAFSALNFQFLVSIFYRVQEKLMVGRSKRQGEGVGMV